MISCTECGHENRDTSLFCTACGHRLTLAGAGARLVSLGRESAGVMSILGDEISVGRDPGNNLVLDDQEVSGRHMRVLAQEGVFYAEDLESTNGTFVNGVQVEEQVLLKDGDLIRVGQTMLKFLI